MLTRNRVLQLRSNSVVGILALAALTVGCYRAPQVRVTWTKPAPIHLGGSTKRLSVVQSEGRRSAREFLINSFLKQTRSQGSFQPTDRTEEGVTVKVAGRKVEVAGAKTPQGADEIFVRMDVLDWGADSDDKVEQKIVTRTRTVTKKDDKGRPYQATETYNEKVDETVKVINGKAVLSVTAFNSQGRTFLAEKEFVGTSEIPKQGGEKDKATEMAGDNAVGQFLAEITPASQIDAVDTDGEEEVQRPMLDMAKGGNLAGAVEHLKEYLAAHPKDSATMYNLAAMLDALGQHRDALPMYDSAVANSGGKDKYVKAKIACAERVAALDALAQP